MRVFLVVLDSVGIGAAPDADKYGDKGANTLGNIAKVAGPLKLLTLEKMGLGCAAALVSTELAINGVAAIRNPVASFGVMEEASEGKDTITGHWEIAGVLLSPGFAVFQEEYPSFPLELTSNLERETGRSIIGNYAASGTEIIEDLGERQMREGCWIVYTSVDSVFQIAAHEEVISLQELYQACSIARRICDEYRIGRVIARPFRGKPGKFYRTENRRDLPLPPPEPTILDRLQGHGIPVVSVGKIDDIFCGRGISKSIHVMNNRDAEKAVLDLAHQLKHGFVFANLIDFDMLYGHRRDPFGYAKALEEVDLFLRDLVVTMESGDVLIVTADHGNDPTFQGSDHTREYVPLILYCQNTVPSNVGMRKGFFDVAQTVAHLFGVPPMPLGRVVLPLPKT